ncbi:hypothetical protein AB4039_24055 [Streptomyces sp. M-16]|uniref:hypothetical protein n=1 Tax=Streptomyces sp. M-16 TaxID=3233040 RepID=UPI0022592B42
MTEPLTRVPTAAELAARDHISTRTAASPPLNSNSTPPTSSSVASDGATPPAARR